FGGLVVIDDLGKVDTNYSRIHTVTSFAELCYSHFISKHTMTVTVEIGEFHGSAILNAPVNFEVRLGLVRLGRSIEVIVAAGLVLSYYFP
ncbi:unnamed protein product, partial [marine sediment metagenome]